MEIKEINNRYSELAKSDCCLSCGSALEYAQPMEGEVCVDLGSGRGTDVIRMAGSVGETGYVYGIDIAEGMLVKARQNAEKFGVTNVLFLQSDLEILPMPDTSVDLIISNCTLNHVMNKQSVWNEIYRILKKNGRFVISDIYAKEPVPEAFRQNPVAIAECWAGAVTRSEYWSHIEKAGFESVEILEESAPYPKGKIEVISFTVAGKKNTGCECKH